jgi:hypothetical protein
VAAGAPGATPAGHDFSRVTVQAPGAAAATPATPGTQGRRTLDEGLTNVRDALALLDLVEGQLFPAYRAAVDALDPGATIELARHVVGSLQVVENTQNDVAAWLESDAAAYMVSMPGQPAQTEEEIIATFTALQTMKTALVSRLAASRPSLAVQIGPQLFRGEPVLGGFTPVPTKDVSGYLVHEAGTTFELISAVVEIRGLAGGAPGTCPVLDKGQRAAIVGKIEPWKSRPVNFAFLRLALQSEGIWDAVASEPGTRGNTLDQTNEAVVDQAAATGALADVGELDIDTLGTLLGVDQRDPTDSAEAPGAVDDDAAKSVFEKLRSAAPDARGPLIRQIHDLGKLEDLCEHLPWRYVQTMHDAVAKTDAGAAALLAPCFEDRGGGRSMHRIYMDQVDENLEEGQTIRAFGWFLLDSLHNAFTAGFQHEYSESYDAHEEGWITDDEFASESLKSLGKSAAILAVSTITGGVAGEFAEGFAMGLGAGRSAAQLIGGGVGGFSAGVSGHFTGDVYDQLLRDKQGFDSVGDYMQSGAMGGATGVALSGVSLGAGKYLRRQRPIDEFAAAHPEMAPTLDGIRATGFRAGQSVKMKVSDLLDLLRSGFGGPGGPDAFAYAGGYGDVRALPPNTEVSVRLRPLRPLTEPSRPLQMSGKNDKPTGSDKPTGTGRPADDRPTPPEGTPVTPKDEPFVAIEQVQVADPDAVSTPVTGKVEPRLPPEEFVARLRQSMTPEQNARFQELRQAFSSDAALVERFHGDFDAVLKAVAGKEARLAGEAASHARVTELRATIEALGLMNRPAVKAAIEGLGGPSDAGRIADAANIIRNEIVSEVAAVDIGRAYPGKQVLRDVQVWEETGASSIAEYKQSVGKERNVQAREIDTADGIRVYARRGDIDILVLEAPQSGGKLRIVHREELKTGRLDKAATADQQLAKVREVVSRAAAGDTKVRLEVEGRNITADVDLASIDSATQATRGPEGKTGFTQSHGITAKHLEQLFRELTVDALNARGSTTK